MSGGNVFPGAVTALHAELAEVKAQLTRVTGGWNQAELTLFDVRAALDAERARREEAERRNAYLMVTLNERVEAQIKQGRDCQESYRKACADERDAAIARAELAARRLAEVVTERDQAQWDAAAMREALTDLLGAYDEAMDTADDPTTITQAARDAIATDAGGKFAERLAKAEEVCAAATEWADQSEAHHAERGYVAKLYATVQQYQDARDRGAATRHAREGRRVDGPAVSGLVSQHCPRDTRLLHKAVPRPGRARRHDRVATEQGAIRGRRSRARLVSAVRRKGGPLMPSAKVVALVDAYRDTVAVSQREYLPDRRELERELDRLEAIEHAAQVIVFHLGAPNSGQPDKIQVLAGHGRAFSVDAAALIAALAAGKEGGA